MIWLIALAFVGGFAAGVVALGLFVAAVTSNAVGRAFGWR